MEPNRTVPANIAAAAAEHHRRHPARSPAPFTPPARRRQIVLADNPPDGPSGRHVVLVARNHGTHLVVALCHSAPELATEIDYVAQADTVGPPYPLVFQPELQACILEQQIAGVVGELDVAAMEALSRSHVTAGQSLVDFDPGQARAPLAGPFDRRWAHKEAEGSRVDQLAAAALRELLD